MIGRIARVLTLAAAAAMGLIWLGDRLAAQSAPTACGTDMRVQVIAATGRETDLQAIRDALDYLGTPYDLYVATDHPGGLTPNRLSIGCRAFYQGVILTSNKLEYAAQDGHSASALTPAEFLTLSNYEATFGIRQVTWYTYPTADLGFNDPERASGDPLTALTTAAGTQVFTSLNPSAAGFPIQSSWTYLTTPLDASTTPLLTDADGHALAAIHVYPDGRENLAMTFDSNPNAIQALLLSYGVVNWVTNGLFIGERHTNISPQVDDLFIDDPQWRDWTPCGTDVDHTGVNARITGADLTAVSNWQTGVRSHAISRDVRLTMAFNGVGASGSYPQDTLVASVPALQNSFFWVSHTYTHANLDAVSYAEAGSQIAQNSTTATLLGLTAYSPLSLVQPDASGLANPNFLLAARDAGVRYLLSDTSKPGQGNPSPNVGRWNTLAPEIFVIPRLPNNLFFNVTTPPDWVAEYNCHYSSFWGRGLNYQEILDHESDQLLAYLLRGNLDPWMFHQSNLTAYDGVHTLLTDLLDRTLAKFSSYVTLPLVSPTLEALGARMADRTTLRTSGISATIQPGVGLVLSSPVDVTVPITGLHLAGAEQYGGQWISWVTLRAHETVVEPLTTVEVTTASVGAALNVASDPAVALTFDEIPFQAADGLTFGGVTFGFTVGSIPSSDAHYNSTDGPEPGTTSYLDNHVLEGSAFGVLTLDFGQPVNVLGFGVAMDTDSVVPAGVTVQLFRPAGPPITVVMDVAPVLRFSEARFAYAGESINRAVLSFDATTGTCASEGNPNGRCAGGRFGIDNLNAMSVDPPAANAGAPQIVASSASVTLTGTASDPNVPARSLTYAWAQTDGPPVSLTGADSLTATFTAPTLSVGMTTQILTFTLTVNNGVLSTHTSTTVKVDPPVGPPTASAGAPQTVASGAAVTLIGAASDPNVPARPLAYMWVQTAGPLVGLTDATTLTPHFTAPTFFGDAPVTLRFALTVNNSALMTTVNTSVDVEPSLRPPTVVQTVYSDGKGARTTPGFSVGAGDLLVAFVSSDGPGELQSASVSGGGLTWTLVQRVNAQYGTSEIWAARATTPLTNVSVSSTQAIQQTGTIVYYQSLTVMTFVGAGGIGAKAAAGAPSGAPTVSLTTTKDQSLVYVVGNDWDNGIARVLGTDQQMVHQYLKWSTHWVQTLAAGAIARAGSSVRLYDTDPTTDHWNFAAVEIIGSAQPPFAEPNVSAGLPQTVASGSTVTLTGTASDPNIPPRPLTYAWTQTGGPAVTLMNATTPAASFTAPTLAAGATPLTLGFTLTVSNGPLATPATTSVVVTPPLKSTTVTQTVFSDGKGKRTTSAFNVNAGDLLVAFVSSDGPAQSQSATVSGGGLTWTLAHRVNVQPGTSEIWTATAAAPLANVTVSSKQAIQQTGTIVYYQSLTVMTFAGASGLGARAAAGGTSGAPTVSLTTTKDGSLVYAVGNDWDQPIARTLGAGQKMVHQYLAWTTHWVQTLAAGAVATAGSPVRLYDTDPSTDHWNFAAVEITVQ
jgi:peptidoglycan/xylan/chitin deacetylase (PgdA/CDA1 family)